MIIICPNCETHFDVPEAALNPVGRTVRCAHCGHKWHQNPPEAEDFGASSDFDDAPLPSPSKPPPPQIEEEEEPPPPAMSFFIDAALEPEAEPEPVSEDLPFPDRRNRAAEIEEEEEPGALFPPPMNDEPPSIFDEPPSTKEVFWPEELTSPIGGSSSGDDEMSLEDEPKSAPPAEGIPAMLKTKKAKAPPPPPKKKRGFFSLALMFPLLPIFILATGLFALRDMVIEQAPFMEEFYDFTDSQTRALYDALGLGGEVIGAGLAFRDIDSERILQDDAEVMIVRGTIVNITNEPQEIPMLRLVLIDSRSVIVQEKEMKPPQFLLSGKSSVPFLMTLDNPDMSASRFEITFSANSVFGQ